MTEAWGQAVPPSLTALVPTMDCGKSLGGLAPHLGWDRAGLCIPTLGDWFFSESWGYPQGCSPPCAPDTSYTSPCPPVFFFLFWFVCLETTPSIHGGDSWVCA